MKIRVYFTCLGEDLFFYFFRCFFIHKRKGLRTYQISYVEKQYESLLRSPSSQRNSPGNILPSIPRSPVTSPRLKEEGEKEDSSIERFQSMTDSPMKQQDNSLLKELYDVMADIQETESESDRKIEDDDVFAKQSPSFSPNLISTPARYSEYLI